MRARGQALIETAIALPVFLIAMFGVIWALQSGVLGERVQMAARYGGMVSAQGNPFQQYSLYSVYGAAAGTPVVAPCGAAAGADALRTPARWSRPRRPARSSGSRPARPSSPERAAGRISTASGLSGPKLLGHAQMTVDATNDVPLSMQAAFGAATTPWNATVNELESPDMATLVGVLSRAASRRSRRRSARRSTNGNAPSVSRHRPAADEPALAQRRLQQLGARRH